MPLHLKFKEKRLTEYSIIYESIFFNTFGVRDLKMSMDFTVKSLSSHLEKH